MVADKTQRKIVKEYLLEHLKLGFSEKDLRSSLVSSGYSAGLVNSCLREVKERKTMPNWFRIPFNLPVKFYFVIALILLVIGTGLLFLIPDTTDCGYSKTCFIANANLGNKVTVREDVAGSILRYTADDGRLTKEFVKFSDNEPAQIRTLLTGKTLECSYTYIDEEIVSGLFGGIQFCQGELIDTIFELGII